MELQSQNDWVHKLVQHVLESESESEDELPEI